MNLSVIENMRNNVRHNQDGKILIMCSRTFRPSRKLFEELGNPSRVKFAIDKDEKILGIAKCDENDVNGFVVSGRTRIISSVELAKEIKKIIRRNPSKVTFTFEGEEDGYFITHLEKGVIDGE